MKNDILNPKKKPERLPFAEQAALLEKQLSTANAIWPCRHCNQYSKIRCTTVNCPRWNEWFTARWQEIRKAADLARASAQ